MRWARPFNDLSSRQRSVLDAMSRSMGSSHWIQGFAGTGKTLLLVHAIERVAAEQPRATLCFITFTHALKDLVATGFNEKVARRLKILTHTQFLKDKVTYDHVFLDEVQDISSEDLQAIRGLSRSLQIAGDPDQRIYGAGAKESDITKIVRPTLHQLIEIFRLTRSLREVALAIFPRARLVEGNQAISSREVTIRLANFADPSAEAAWVFAEARDRARPHDPSGILLSTHDAIYTFACNVASQLNCGAPPRPKRNFSPGISGLDYTPFNDHWKALAVPLMYVGGGNGSFSDSDSKPLVYLMTYHSAKGLDFMNVFLPQVNEDLWLGNRKELDLDPELARRLMFVAVTRSRENLFISHTSKKPHPLLERLPSGVVRKIRPARSEKQEEEFF